jgi:hypothetical protein
MTKQCKDAVVAAPRVRPAGNAHLTAPSAFAVDAWPDKQAIRPSRFRKPGRKRQPRNDHTDCGVGGRPLWHVGETSKRAKAKTIFPLPDFGAVEEMTFFRSVHSPMDYDPA